MYGINVVNFSPFLSYAMFGGAGHLPITVTKTHGTIQLLGCGVGFFVEKSLTTSDLIHKINRIWPRMHFCSL